MTAQDTADLIVNHLIKEKQAIVKESAAALDGNGYDLIVKVEDKEFCITVTEIEEEEE